MVTTKQPTVIVPAPRYKSPRDRGFAHFALGRVAHGAGPADMDAILRGGFEAWMEEQLAPVDADDPAPRDRLASFTLKIKYNAGNGQPGPNNTIQTWDAVDELRPLQYLDAPIDKPWALTDRSKPMDGAERARPRDEVIMATILRATHSRWQLRELLVGFWHDHFNVDAHGGDQLAAALPSYDRDVIRAHALGNFREMLEAVAASTAMQFYLSNRSSRAGAANENYARELFELHTLGRDAYLNDQYDRWRDVPGALEGKPQGYIDQDVYEAARAFTGWTIEDGGRIDNATEIPKTGRFRYIETWHDGYQKRVLATEFDAFAAALGDGRKVLDLVSDHPATARLIATKLTRRFLGDPVPAALVARAAETFIAQRRSPRQLAEVARVIILSPEFAASRGQKVRRPLALAAGFARATELDLMPTMGLANQIASCGQRLFGWPAPNGYPDENGFWLGASTLRQRWALVHGLANNAWGNGVLSDARVTALGRTSMAGAVTAWLAALTGAAEPATVRALLDGLDSRGDEPVAAPKARIEEVRKKIGQLAAYAAMSPAFQNC